MRTIWKLIVLPLVGMLLIAIFGAASTQQDGEWVAPPSADKLVNPLANDLKAQEKGKKIYHKLCWTCHGKQGKGDGPASAALNPKAADHTSEKVQSQSDGAIYWKISNGRGMMPVYSQILSKTERWQVTTYIRQLSGL